MINEIKYDYKLYKKLLYDRKRPSFLEKAAVILHPGFFAILVHRYSNWLGTKKNRINKPTRFVLKFFYHLGTLICAVRSKIMIIETIRIGCGIYLSEKGNIIMGGRKWGNNCTVHHNVTVGVSRHGLSPEIGNNVWIGPNSVIYGKIKIGDRVTILEGTVLSRSVPDMCLVKGNPGRVFKRNFDNSSFWGMSDPKIGIDE